MLNQQTIDQLRQLKMVGFLEALEQQRAQPATHDLPFEQRLALLIEREALHRDNRRLERLLRACLLYTSPSPRDRTRSRMPSSA